VGHDVIQFRADVGADAYGHVGLVKGSGDDVIISQHHRANPFQNLPVKV
jgi:hypothetical protein